MLRFGEGCGLRAFGRGDWWGGCEGRLTTDSSPTSVQIERPNADMGYPQGLLGSITRTGAAGGSIRGSHEASK